MNFNRIILSFIPLLLLACRVSGGEEDLKSEALEMFKKADYAGAVEILKEAAREFPGDAEVFYYLGYFTHYLCYDSIPLSGYDSDRSDEVLGYLRKAVELRPDYGDAYYFIGAERGARARLRLMRGDLAGAREEFRKGMSEGAFPDWLVEYGRNTLRSCRKDAILILGGDADINPVQYLQLVEGYRTDVTAVPRAGMSRPWFVRLIKEGVEGVITPAPVSWSEYQIMNMHPYKWKTNLVTCSIDQKIRDEFGIEKDRFSWKIEPDINGEKLSQGAAAVADIIISNRFERPVYFSLACGGSFGLKDNLQLCGFARRLLPVKAYGTDLEVDARSAASVLLDSNNYAGLPSVSESYMPRVSGILVNYPAALLMLYSYQMERGLEDEPARILDLIEETGMKKYIEMDRFDPYFDRYMN